MNPFPCGARSKTWPRVEVGDDGPPPGDKAHHYVVVTVFALKVDALPVPPDATSALLGPMLNANALAKASLTATYKR